MANRKNIRTSCTTKCINKTWFLHADFVTEGTKNVLATMRFKKDTSN